MPNTLPDTVPETVPPFCWIDGLQCEIVRVSSPTDAEGRRWACVIDLDRDRVEIARRVPGGKVCELVETTAARNDVSFAWVPPPRRIPLFPTTEYPAYG